MSSMKKGFAFATIAAPVVIGASGSEGSPDVLSGNTVQIPINIPVNLCGNTVNVIALLNPAFGQSCVNA
ncbi:chaplin [Streptomyces sp. NPDC087297]|uniref:chaplin n=1 Tax=Streptomyces sp. NPDC087297 TaxID=3365778 RepID=UPI0037F79F49